MPVFGHAVAGWALSLGFAPREGSAASRRSGGLWTPTLIALSFLPDLASQGAIAAGAQDPMPVTHSFVLATGAAVLLASGLRLWSGMSLGHALALGMLLVPGHVLMDLLQHPWRSPFWPFSSAATGLPWPLLPQRPGAEALLSGVVLLVVLAGRHGRIWGLSPAAASRPRPIATGVTALILLLAGFTHHLRGFRESRYEEALERLDAGDAVSALRLVDEADRWPWPIRPGRIDYLRAEAHQALHEPDAAERHLFRALRADPGYFWAWADLCVLYATSDRPLEERRLRSGPCLAQLMTRFAEHPDMARMVGKVERALDRR